jgi:arylsulfatase A-like enzyme
MNIIVMMADSWRFDYLGCYGNDWIKTPNIDRLAEDGVLFENAYAEGCPTIPTRRALFTGRYTLPYSGWRKLTPEDVTLTDLMWTHRIQTAMVTDCPMMHMPGYGYARGFNYVDFIRGHQWDSYYQPLSHDLDIDRFHRAVTEKNAEGQMVEIGPSMLSRQELIDYLPLRATWESDEDQMVAMTVKAGIKYLDEVDKNAPFFLWLDSFDPHEPWDPPSIWDPDLKCPYDPDYSGMELINPVPTRTVGYVNEAEAHHIRMLYAEKVTMVDKWLGKFIDRLKKLDLYDNSMIVFLSDHGEPLGDGEHGHGIVRKCRPWPYEELSHIPLIIKHPEGMKGRISSFVETVDVAATIMDHVREATPPVANLVSWANPHGDGVGMQGKSLLPLMRGQVDKVKEFAITGYFNMSWSIVSDDWTYVHWLDSKEDADDSKKAATVGLANMVEDQEIWTCAPGSAPETPFKDELYDRRADPYQLNNLIDSKPDVADEMLKRLMEYMLELRTAG